MGEVMTVVADATGHWQVTPTLALPEGGPHVFTLSARDAAGNVATTTLPVTIDTQAPTPPAGVLDTASDSGITGDSITNDNTPAISGTGNPGDTITVTSPMGEVMTTLVAANGTWQVTPTVALPEGGPQEFSFHRH